MVAEVDAVESAEDCIYWTVIARYRRAAGVPRPGHVFIRIPQELGKHLSSLANACVGKRVVPIKGNRR
jgi:hypothetical protein